MKRIKTGVAASFSLLALTIAVLMSCSGNVTVNAPRFSDNNTEIVSLSFPGALNSSLPSDVYATIDGDKINAVVPSGTGLKGLVAEYVTDSDSVDAGGVSLKSGVTALDYSSPVQYTVTGAVGEKKVYTVSVTEAPSADKYMRVFSIDNINGVIDEGKSVISVEMPCGTAVTSLVPSFQAVCASVSANGKVQRSGLESNDFSSPVIYTLTAEDGSRRDYTVTVSVLPDTSREITSFSFQADNNASLGSNVDGTISGNTIDVTVPSGAATSSLVATVETTGGTVTVEKKPQENGVTGNDFSGTVEYVVTAQDGSSQTYTVNVSQADRDDKSITGFTVNGEPAAIDEATGTITVNLPPDGTAADVVPEFTTTGGTVKVNGVEQSSGETTVDLGNNTQYVVTAADGSTRAYNVRVNDSADIAGLWTFDRENETGYTISGATRAPALEGSGLYFNEKDYVLVPDSPGLTLATAGTIEAVIKPSSRQPFAGIVHKGVESDFSDEAYSLQYWGASGRLRLILNGAGGKSVHVDSRDRVKPGSWYHVVATWDDKNVSLYLNGELERSVKNTAGPLLDSEGGLVIGAQMADERFNHVWDNLGFNGIVDYVRVLNRAMTDDQVEASFSALPSGESRALTAYLLASAYRNSDVIMMLLAAVALVLAVVYAINLYRARRTV